MPSKEVKAQLKDRLKGAHSLKMIKNVLVKCYC